MQQQSLKHQMSQRQVDVDSLFKNDHDKRIARFLNALVERVPKKPRHANSFTRAPFFYHITKVFLWSLQDFMKGFGRNEDRYLNAKFLIIFLQTS